MKSVIDVLSAPSVHWVGDGFPVRSLFSHMGGATDHDPFLMLDHAGPHAFTPTDRPRGVGEHPHRGFETVTVVYQGELEHRDSTGAGGRIGPGDVQWMTAGAGVLHEEFHSQEFTRRGGALEMAQLWVNLPAASKMTEPGYQSLQRADIPVANLPDAAGTARVIAGTFQGMTGPARTHSPMNVLDLRLEAGRRVELPLTDGWTSLLVVLHGTVLVNDDAVARGGQVVRLDRAGKGGSVESNTDAKILVLEGEPLGEPVVGYGPFVMNTQQEIRQALDDFRSGRFGRLAG
ncbi:MAG TPA: pirin family protein [Alphaproteobacteria bacterium]|nr:pirin family protein [Alphaproteobacteria bacterium]